MPGLDSPRLGGLTALHLAAQHGFYVLAEALLRKGADVNALNSDLQTPLRLAMEHGHVDVAILLAKASDMPSAITG